MSSFRPRIYWADAFADLEGLITERCAAIVTDPPYSERTHKGSAALTPIPYASISLAQAEEIGRTFARVCAGWVCVFCDHTMIDTWSRALASSRRYVFAPIACVTIGRTVRIRGDGPASWTDYLIVSRPRTNEFARWGALPGAYVGTRGTAPASERERQAGDKSDALMAAIVRDYTRPGDLVVDPFAGSGTTGAACVSLRRRFLGLEIDPDRARTSDRRIGAFYDSMSCLYPETKRYG